MEECLLPSSVDGHKVICVFIMVDRTKRFGDLILHRLEQFIRPFIYRH